MVATKESNFQSPERLFLFFFKSFISAVDVVVGAAQRLHDIGASGGQRLISQFVSG